VEKNEQNKQTNIVEKRRFFRFLVRYTAKAYIKGEIMPATVMDLSEGGVGVIIPQKLLFHDELFIKSKFRIEEAHRSHVQFKARVIWTEPTHINEMHIAGLEITEITHTDVRIFQQLLEELYTRDFIQTKYEKDKSVI